MSTSTSTSAIPPMPRIKLTNAAAANPRPMSGKHPPPGGIARSNPPSKARPQPLQAPAPGQANVNGVSVITTVASLKAERRKKELAKRVIDDAEDTITVRSKLPTKKLPPVPYVKTTSYILRKYPAASNAPSLIIHLHPMNFRFDGQDGSFSYTSPMRLFLECLRNETIPHENVEEFRDAGIRFYDGCLIIQVQDHRSSTAKATSKTDNTTVPGSIHNYNLWITPSPTVPYPDAAKQEPKPPKVVEVKKKEVEKSEKAKGPKIYTTVMHPTPLSLYADMEVLACTLAPVAIRANMRNGSVSVAPTPTSATNPHTPGLTANAAAGTPTSPVFKKPRMMLSDSTAPNFEANTLLATSPQLILTPAKSAEQAHEIHKALRNPRHCNPIPPPKTRKRTIAELQADEAAAAGQEAFLLLGSPQSAAPESAVADGPEPTFKRFKAIEEIKRKAVEKKREEKAKEVQKARAEHDARQQREKQQRQQQQREDLEQRKMAAVRAASASQHGSPVLPQAVTMHHTSSAQNNGSISVTTTRPGSAGAVPQPVMSREQAAARMQSQYSTTQQQQVAHHQLQMLRQQQHQQQQQQQQQQHQQQQAAAAQAAAQAAAAAHGHDPHLAVSHPSQASPRLAQASPRIAQASPRIAPSQPHPLSQPPHTSAHLTSTAAATNAYQQQQIRLAVAQQQAAHRASPLHHPPGTVLGPNGQPQGHPVQQHPVQMPPQYRIMQPQQHNAAAAAAAMQFQQLSPQQQLFYQQQQQHHHQQQQMYHQQQMQAGRGAALVGKTAGGAIRAGQMGRGIMMPNGQPGQPQGQFQDLGFAIGAAPQGMQVGMQGMMGRGQMGMGRGR